MIRVGGVDMDTDLELLELYFESPKKSDGDKITNLTDHLAQGYVVLTFEDPAGRELLLIQFVCSAHRTSPWLHHVLSAHLVFIWI